MNPGHSAYPYCKASLTNPFLFARIILFSLWLAITDSLNPPGYNTILFRYCMVYFMFSAVAF